MKYIVTYAQLVIISNCGLPLLLTVVFIKKSKLPWPEDLTWMMVPFAAHWDIRLLGGGKAGPSCAYLLCLSLRNENQILLADWLWQGSRSSCKKKGEICALPALVSEL